MPTTREKIYEKVLSIFVVKDDPRRLMNSPFIAFGKAMATNSFSLVTVPVWKWNYSDESERIKDVYPCEHNTQIVFSAKALRDALAQVPLIDEVIEKEVPCTECAGSGDVDFEYTTNSGRTYYLNDDCPACQGTGINEVRLRTRTGNKISDPKAIILFHGMRFSVERVREMMQVVDLVNAPCITIVREADSSMLFEIGEVELLMMATYSAFDTGACAEIQFTEKEIAHE